MKRIFLFVSLLLLLSVQYLFSAQNLPASLTQNERAILSSYLKERLSQQDFTAGSVPDGQFFAPAEFEQADAVLFAWAGYRDLLGRLIKEVTNFGYRVVLVVESDYDLNNAKGYLERVGARMENLSFLRAPLNSIWIRDYGPWFILDKKGERAVIDLIYNRPRPQDDEVPVYVAKKLGIERYAPGLILPGGNLIVDGKGTAFMTDVVFDPSEGGDPNLSREKLQKIFRDYFNCDRVVILKKMKRDGTGHLDMFSKLLPNNIFLVGEYTKPEDGAANNYDILNENAKKLAQLKDLTGKPYKVVRIPMPPYKYGVSYTYTNSLIFNKLVLVPVYGFPQDEEALRIYRKCLPGYKVVGVDCSSIISANGAIHCISKLIMSPAIRVKVGEEELTIDSNYPLWEAKLVSRGSEGELRVEPLEIERVTRQTLDISKLKNASYLYLKDTRGFEKIVRLK